MGPGGMHSFGHAAYFGLGAYGAALARQIARGADGASRSPLAPLAAALGALLFGWFAVRLSGVYLAMLTLAFAQIVWAIVFQWENAHRRLERRARHLADRAVRPAVRSIFLLTLALAVARRAAAAAHPVRAVRLCDARRPRFAAARGGDRHRRQARALARLRHRRHGVRRRRRRSSPSPRARSRRRPSQSAARSTAWSWCCSAASRR